MILELIAVSFGAWLIALFLFHRLYKTKPVVFHSYAILFPCTVAGLFMVFAQQDTHPPPPDTAEFPPLQTELITDPPPKKWADLESELRNNLVDDPKNTEIIKELSGNLIAQEKFTQAASLLRKHLKNAPNEDLQLQLSAAQFAHGLYMAEHKKYDKALILLNKAKSNAPQTAPFKADLDAFIRIIEQEKTKASPPKKTITESENTKVTETETETEEEIKTETLIDVETHTENTIKDQEKTVPAE